MPRNARRELDRLLLEIALAEGTLVQRVLIGVVGLVFVQPEDVPEHLQADLLALQSQSAWMGSLTPEQAKNFVVQLVRLRNQILEEYESVRLAQV